MGKIVHRCVLIELYNKLLRCIPLAQEFGLGRLEKQFECDVGGFFRPNKLYLSVHLEIQLEKCSGNFAYTCM